MSKQFALLETIDAASICIYEYGSKVPSNLESRICLPHSGMIYL